MKYIKKIIYILSLSLLLSPLFAGGRGETASDANSLAVKSSGITSALTDLNILYQYLERNFLWDIDLENVEEALTKALIAALDDEYSEYITEENADEFDESITGQYVGIGVYLTKLSPENADFEKKETYMIKITGVFPGSPADRIGLRANDLISHINGESVFDLTINEASKKLRGEKDVEMTITVNRGNSVFDLRLTPEEITTPHVDSDVLEGTKYGYLSIYDFTQSTYPTVKEQLEALSARGINALIIDLRNNPGGVVDAAIKIANLFLPDGEPIVTTKHKADAGRKDSLIIASSDSVKYTYPLVILVNEGTASAAEILSAALKENDRAVLVGQKTFGKGIIQEFIHWKNGYIKYTAARYLTPMGNDIHTLGITPDIEVDAKDYSSEEIDSYYQFGLDYKDEIQTFAEKHPEYSRKNIELFVKEFKDSGLSDKLLTLYIRNEYYSILPYDETPVADAYFDPELAIAIEYLDSL